MERELETMGEQVKVTIQNLNAVQVLPRPYKSLVFAFKSEMLDIMLWQRSSCIREGYCKLDISIRYRLQPTLVPRLL